MNELAFRVISQATEQSKHHGNIFVEVPLLFGDCSPFSLVVSPHADEGGLVFSLQDPFLGYEIGYATIDILSQDRCVITSLQDHVGYSWLYSNGTQDSVKRKRSANNKQHALRRQIAKHGGSPKPQDIPEGTARNPGVEELTIASALLLFKDLCILSEDAQVVIPSAHLTYWGEKNSLGTEHATLKAVGKALENTGADIYSQLVWDFEDPQLSDEGDLTHDYRSLAANIYQKLVDNLEVDEPIPFINTPDGAIPFPLYFALLIAQDIPDAEKALEITNRLRFASYPYQADQFTDCIEELALLTTSYAIQFAAHKSAFSNIACQTTDEGRQFMLQAVLATPYAARIHVGATQIERMYA